MAKAPHRLSLEELAFYRAIWERPNDNAPRLIYTDWLEDRGEQEYAEYIRESITYADLSPPSSAYISLGKKWRNPAVNERTFHDFEPSCKYTIRFPTAGMLVPEGWAHRLNREEDEFPPPEYLYLNKGLIYHVHCSLFRWMHLSRHIAHHPIATLSISDRIPYRAVDRTTELGRTVFWTFGSLGQNHSSYLPESIRPHLNQWKDKFTVRHLHRPGLEPIGFATVASAYQALHAALLDEAREAMTDDINPIQPDPVCPLCNGSGFPGTTERECPACSPAPTLPDLD